MSVLQMPLPWATSLMRNGQAFGDVPVYGSPEWVALPDDDRRKVAACVQAAEAWRTYWEPTEHARRLRVELEAAQGRNEEDPTWTPEVVASVRGMAGRATFAELCEERGERTEATRARWNEQRVARSIGL